jgi:tetratricopeptide (TPR) repeat protein
MRAYVFTDRSLQRHAGQFVWLAMNGEKAGNAPFRKKYAIAAWPTYLVIDPFRERVRVSWVGGATVSQLHQFFDVQSAAWQRHARGRGAGSPADARLAIADSLYGENDYPRAAAVYGAALEAAPPGWPSWRRAVEARLFALSESDSSASCAELALRAWPAVRRTSSAANVAGSGLECAIQLPNTDPRRAALVDSLDRATRETLADSTVEMSGDDRSGLYIALLDAHPAESDSVEHLRIAILWAEGLERDAAKARTPDERAVYDSHRLSAYLEIGHPERAVPMLEASEKALPNDYNPPARLAIAYRAMRRWDDALAASDRALAKAYGPRKLLLMQNRADIYVGRGDREAARHTLEEALTTAQAMPEGQRSRATIAAIRKKLDAMR